MREGERDSHMLTVSTVIPGSKKPNNSVVILV